MRILIAFLLCFVFSSSVANAAKPGSIISVKKPVKNSILILTCKVNSPIDEDHTVNKSLHDQLDFIRQTASHPIKLVCYCLDTFHFTKLKAVEQILPSLSNKVSFKYSFIFNFLFPKHTFW